MTTPKRIQRRRTKGWRMPPNTVCVARPGRWGNRFFVRQYPPGTFEVFDGETLTEDAWSEPLLLDSFPSKVLAMVDAVARFERYLLDGKLTFIVDDVRRELRGKNLACWCPIGSPCHADVLLKIASSEEL